MEFDIRPSDKPRFLKFVDIRLPNECWPWIGKAKHDYGYGSFTLKTTSGKFRGVVSSRAVWLLCVGPIAEGAHILHNCDNPSCCNLQHLRLGTHQDNMQDRRLRGTHYYSRTTCCKNGHAWTAKNTCILKTGAGKGTKRCRACRRASMRKRTS